VGDFDSFTGWRFETDPRELPPTKAMTVFELDL
jgi:hypothetical protein